MAVSRRTVRQIVKKELNKQLETKLWSIDQERTAANARALNQIELSTIPVNAGINGRVGNEIDVRGLRVRCLWENPSINHPLLIRYAVLIIHGEQGTTPGVFEVFRGRDGQVGVPYLLADTNDKNLQWNPFNEDRVKVLAHGHETINRFTNTANEDSRGRIKYMDKFIKLNMPIEFDGVNTGLRNQDKRIIFVWWYTDAGLDTEATGFNGLTWNFSSQIYFKDG